MAFPFKLPLLLDGATGTNLMLMGMPQGVCVEKWVLEHPDAILKLQSAFVEAGSDVLYAPTFSANSEKLSLYGLQDKQEQMITDLVALCKQAANGKALVAGDLSPTGQFCEPFGETPFLELMNIYAQQAFYLKNAGVDLLVIETMMSLSELRAAVLGARQTGLPIFATITVNEQGKTITGADVLSCLVTLQGLGVAAFGLNCSTGPQDMIPQIERIFPYAKVPLIAKPNAGMPCADNPLHYDLTPEQMAENAVLLLRAGACVLGGCCGSTPEHVRAIRRAIDTIGPLPPKPEEEEEQLLLAGETLPFFLREDFEYSEPVECSVDMSDDLIDLEDSGCDVILVEVKTPDDAYHFSQNAHMARLPIAFVSNSEEALEAALLYYNGRAILDSRCELPEEVLKQLAEGYGAQVV